MGPYLAKSNVDAIEFIGCLGVSPNLFQQHDAWFERDMVLKAGSELARTTGNPFAGAYAGNDVPIPDFGSWGTIVSQAETLKQACRLMSGKLHLVERGSLISAIDFSDKLRLAFTFVGSVCEDPLQIKLATIAMMKNVALQCGVPDAVRVHLTMPWSYKARHLDEAFGERIEFGSTFDGIEIDNDVLALCPATSSKPDMTTRSIDTTIATARLIDDLLPLGKSSIHQVANMLSLSVRTLQRRLKHCGVDYEDLLDLTRRDSAIACLADGASDMAELAMRVGYSDPANFTRAFKRWTGQPPTRYRPPLDGQIVTK